jgi:hypothetical protein
VKTATTLYHYQITISPAYEGRCRHAPARTLGHPDENPALGGATTEITWRPAAGSREEKTERLKPWVTPRRQTLIMIDPACAGDYGHPSFARPESPSHHVSPVPHPRRGHWHHLAAETGRRGSDPHGSALWNGSTRGEPTRFSQNLSAKYDDPCETLHQTGLS